MVAPVVANQGGVQGTPSVQERAVLNKRYSGLQARTGGLFELPSTADVEEVSLQAAIIVLSEQPRLGRGPGR